MKRAVALTLGDPGGIGPELALAAWRQLRISQPFFVIGDSRSLKRCGSSPAIVEIDSPEEACAAMESGVPLLNHPVPSPCQVGKPDARNADAIVEIIERAVSFALSGQAVAVCTNPVGKAVFKAAAGHAIAGHTELLASLCDVRQSVMMLVCPQLRVVPTTIHIPLSEVPGQLSAALIEETVKICHKALVTDFGIENPRIVVAGLNPHAGEGGVLGNEEESLIFPAIRCVRRSGIVADGPFAADTLFSDQARQGYDAAVCMYHDQALIPVKTLDFHGCANITLGLPIVRTSPAHGTAFDIAGQGIARSDSLIAALKLAGKLGNRRLNA